MPPLRLRWFNRIRGRWYPDDAEIGDLPILLLVYLGFLLLPLVAPRFPQVSWLATLLAVVVFLPLYFWGWWRPRQLPLLSVAIALLAYALTPLNPGACTMLVYALAQAAELRSLRQALLLAAAILCGYALLLWWIRFPAVVMLAAVIPGLAVFFGNRSFREMQRRRAVLRLSQEEVRRLSERAERERIARDLHDLLGHTLSLIAIKAELARKLATRAPERAGDEMAQVEQLARASLEEVRMALHDMRRATLDQELAQIRLSMEAAGVSLQLERGDVMLDRACEEALAYVLREAGTNIIRHARAGKAQISIREEAGHVLMEVSDDGRGGAPELDLREASNGLRGMRERVHACGGELQLRSARGSGTRLRVRMPRLMPADAAAPTRVWGPQESLS